MISRLRIIGAEDQNWREFGPGEVGIGWDSMVLGLAIHLVTGSPSIRCSCDRGRRPRPAVASSRGRRGLALSECRRRADPTVVRALTIDASGRTPARNDRTPTLSNYSAVRPYQSSVGVRITDNDSQDCLPERT